MSVERGCSSWTPRSCRTCCDTNQGLCFPCSDRFSCSDRVRNTRSRIDDCLINRNQSKSHVTEHEGSLTIITSHGTSELGFVFESRDKQYPVVIAKKARSELHQKLDWKGDHFEAFVASAIHSHENAGSFTIAALSNRAALSLTSAASLRNPTSSRSTTSSTASTTALPGPF